MARQKSNDYCMFCDSTPCSCSKPDKPKLRPTLKPTTKSAPTSVSIPTADPVPTSVPDPLPTRRANLLSGRKKNLTQDERAHSDAIICLLEHFQIHKDDLERNRKLIDLPDHRIDALIWRQDNADENIRRRAHRKPG